MKKRVKNWQAVFFLFAAILLMFLSSAVNPYGAQINPLNVSTAIPDIAQSIGAQAGNVTELNVFGYSTTQTWQGYYGNVTGTIQLADGSDFVMYNWSAINPKGEIYASTNSTIQWSNIQCFNFTAAGNYSSDIANAGSTSLYGLNVSQLETIYGINSIDADGVEETFIYDGAIAGHAAFYTASREFEAGECKSTRVYDNSGAGVKNNFEEVLLYEPNTASVIFTSLLNQDIFGFNNRTHDFEMLVLEDGHGADTSSTPYFFYVELQ